MKPKGFTLRMIHKDSEESPFYNPLDRLMTPDERLETLIDQSRARARYIASQINPDVYAPVAYEAATFYYAASVGIGTFPGRPGFMNYYLVIDSGSDLTWLQCQGATQYFNQEPPLYPWQYSQSYIPTLCKDRRSDCEKCNDEGYCIYKVPYVSSQVTSGIYARENFTFDSTTRGRETFQLRMGCGFIQANFSMGRNSRRNRIAGILGLGRGPLSFVTQLGEAGGKFSYCFEKDGQDMTGNTFLSIGADATIPGEVRSTDIKAYSRTHYYLILEGISVDGNRLLIPRNEFEFRNGAGGCVIDSGAPFTTMYKNIFDRVKRSVVEYFHRVYHMRPAVFDGSHLCFYTIPGYDEYRKPTITFHFQHGADFVVSETWYIYRGKICLAISRSDSNTPAVLFGAFQQTNKRILYDNRNSRLSFADEDCGTIPRG
ncbi:aspartic proteinase nepenthesin-1-like [Papaver somniferum]|uniref:aspartic proteinase nepenthesin-1-like n=1 Tax=Papaver somniferum TaxID=3469 RepID=UPI000E7006DF|nr:aspartic proteinase nepenthesin-1-like [Papaver somniferum]